jgi:hypothetical protein
MNVSTDPNYEVSEPGTYSLLVSNEVSGCTSEATVIVGDLRDTPSLSATVDGFITCAIPDVNLSATSSSALDLTYQWSSPSGTIVSQQNHTTEESGIWEVLITDENGCTNNTSLTIDSDIALPVVDAGPDQIFNAGSQLTLDGSLSSTGPEFIYTWYGPNGFTSEEISPVVNLPGTYSLTLINSINGCENSDEVLVLIENEIQETSFVAIDTVRGKYLDTVVVALTVFGFTDKNNFDLNVRFDETNFEFIDVLETSNLLGSYNTSNVQLAEPNRVSTTWGAFDGEAKTLPDSEVLCSFRLLVLSQECTDFELSFGEILAAAGQAYLSFPDDTEDGLIMLDQEVGAPCDDKNEQTEMEVFQQDCTCNPLTLSNTISPGDGNGDNDVLKFSDEAFIEDSRLVIMNRWGNIVYDKRNYTNDWDASDVPAGVYFYILKIGNQPAHKITLTIIK